MASMSSLEIKFLLVITCMLSINLAQSLQPNSDHPLLEFPSGQFPQQKFLFQIWQECHDAFLQTGNCLIDILKVIHGLGGGGGGDPGAPAGGDAPPPAGGGDAPSPAAPPAQPPKAGGGSLAAQLDDAGGIIGGIPGIGGGIPGIGGGIPGIGGGIPGIGGGISPACCEALTGLQNTCPVIRLNPFYGPFVLKFCPPAAP